MSSDCRNCSFSKRLISAFRSSQSRQFGSVFSNSFYCVSFTVSSLFNCICLLSSSTSVSSYSIICSYYFMLTTDQLFFFGLPKAKVGRAVNHVIHLLSQSPMCLRLWAISDNQLLLLNLLSHQQCLDFPIFINQFQTCQQSQSCFKYQSNQGYSLLMSIKDNQIEDTINKIMQKFDYNENGTLEPQQIADLLNSSFKEMGIDRRIDRQELQQFLKQTDTNQDKKLDREELKIFLTKSYK